MQIDFSKLSEGEKKQYMDFLLKNQIIFTKAQQELGDEYSATIKIDAKEYTIPYQKGNSYNQLKFRFDNQTPEKVYEDTHMNSCWGGSHNNPGRQDKLYNNNRTPPPIKPSRERTTRSKSPYTKRSQTDTSFRQQTSHSPNINMQAALSTPEMVGGSKKLQDIKYEWRQKYSEFCLYLKLENRFQRPKRMSKEWMVKQINDIFSQQFKKEVAHLAIHDKNQRKVVKPFTRFPKFVYHFYRYQPGFEKHKVEETCVNLLQTVQFYEKKSQIAQIFDKFLSEEYSQDDLIFFLFVRMIVMRTLMKDYYYDQKQTEQLDKIYVNQGKASRIIRQIYGENEQDKIQENIQLIKNNMTYLQDLPPLKQEKEITALNLVAILLDNYHLNSSVVQEDYKLKKQIRQEYQNKNSILEEPIQSQLNNLDLQKQQIQNEIDKYFQKQKGTQQSEQYSQKFQLNNNFSATPQREQQQKQLKKQQLENQNINSNNKNCEQNANDLSFQEEKFIQFWNQKDQQSEQGYFGQKSDKLKIFQTTNRSEHQSNQNNMVSEFNQGDYLENKQEGRNYQQQNQFQNLKEEENQVQKQSNIEQHNSLFQLYPAFASNNNEVDEQVKHMQKKPLETTIQYKWRLQQEIENDQEDNQAGNQNNQVQNDHQYSIQDFPQIAEQQQYQNEQKPNFNGNQQQDLNYEDQNFNMKVQNQLKEIQKQEQELQKLLFNDQLKNQQTNLQNQKIQNDDLYREIIEQQQVQFQKKMLNQQFSDLSKQNQYNKKQNNYQNDLQNNFHKQGTFSEDFLNSERSLGKNQQQENYKQYPNQISDFQFKIQNNNWENSQKIQDITNYLEDTNKKQILKGNQLVNVGFINNNNTLKNQESNQYLQEEQNKQLGIQLNHQLANILDLKLRDFIDKMVNEKAKQKNINDQFDFAETMTKEDIKSYLFENIQQQLKLLLKSLFQKNWTIWEQNCEKENNLSQIQQWYWTTLEEKYNELQKLQQQQQLTEKHFHQICKKIFQTPELARYIGKILVFISERSGYEIN